MKRVEVFVGIGSNIDKEKNIVSAVSALQTAFGALRVSPIYQSAAVGFVGDDFYNLVVSFRSSEPPFAVADKLRSIELAHGRTVKGNHFSSRTLDLDPLLYGSLVIDEGPLQLPHSQLTSYAFILKPLADLAGAYKHPRLGQSYNSLYRRLAGALQPVHQVKEGLIKDLPCGTGTCRRAMPLSQHPFKGAD